MSREYVLKPFHAPVNLQIDYAGELNPQQHAAVTAPPGPALVIAGAGSGKTRTLTYRVAYLLEHGVAPERILLLTFTNKAAREMMRRVSDLLGGDMRNLWGGTFHSIGARMLRLHAEAVGYRKDFTIMDREDATELLKACLQDAPIDRKDNLFPKPDVLGEILSMAVNTRRSVRETIDRGYEHFVLFTGQIEDVARRYAQRKRTANVMDFDDLLALWVELMHDATISELYQRRFEYVLVDEYQDTNKLQADLIDRVASRHQNVMVVGDDAQSIYSWRGANFRNILEFPDRYPTATTYKIENNYRSTPEILSVANAAIAPNIHQFAKTLTPSRKSGVKPALVVCGDASQQAAFVAQRILELREEGASLNSIAILYRSHFHALEVQLELVRRGIPVNITSGIRFFEQAHIKDVAAYLKLIVNPMDEPAFKRLVRMLPGVGEKAAARLWTRFSEEMTRLSVASWDPDSSASGRPSLAGAMQKSVTALPKKALTAWAEFTTTISQIEADPIRDKPADLIQHVLEAGYQEYLQANYTNHRQRKEDLAQLSNFAVQFTSSEEFLTQLSLLTDVESEGNQTGTGDEDQVRLSTVHQAKGLEFDFVFIIMLCDGLFPSSRSLEEPDDEEEERRLFYVGITRAKSELYLSYPLIRATPGRGGASMQVASRFLKEIPGELLNEWQLRPYFAYGSA